MGGALCAAAGGGAAHRGGHPALAAEPRGAAHRLREKGRSARAYAARTMIWSGPIVGAFVVFHVLHLTAGKIVELHELGPNMPDVRFNVITGFSNPWIAGFYILAMILLCLHLYHGMWSMFQSLGISHPRYTPLVKKGPRPCWRLWWPWAIARSPSPC
jgi:succinate dehydrogenase/fumarate reductase cytochrome b subunit (b558 family)